jgi:hypothetical protein
LRTYSAIYKAPLVAQSQRARSSPLKRRGPEGTIF